MTAGQNICWRSSDMSCSTAEAFRRQYIQMIGSRPDEAEVRAAESVLRGLRPDETGEVRSYVSTLGAYEERYRGVINRVYSINCDATPDDDTVRHFLKRFVDPDYTPEHLADEIVNGEPDPEPAAAAVACETDRMLGFARRWRSATGRKIDIHEFVRYYREDPGEAAICEICAGLDSALAFADGAYRGYAGRGLSRDEFLERYGALHDSPGFDDEVIARLLAGDEYRREMCKALQRGNATLFGEDLHPEDMEHAFRVLQDLRAPLGGEEVNNELIRMHDELRDITGAVQAVYQRVLGRPADGVEERECVPEFRVRAREEASRELEARLCGSLEFHDVIKERYRGWFERRHGRAASQREVYEALRDIVQRHGRDMTLARSGLE